MSIDTGQRNRPNAVSAGPPLPLWAEIGRQLRRRRTIGIFIVLTVLPLVLLLAFWLGNDRGRQRLGGARFRRPRPGERSEPGDLHALCLDQLPA